MCAFALNGVFITRNNGSSSHLSVVTLALVAVLSAVLAVEIDQKHHVTLLNKFMVAAYSECKTSAPTSHL